jgi:ribosomal protein S18 acetylase RimI-like enzyme
MAMQSNGPPAVTLRTATLDDAPALADLSTQLGYPDAAGQLSGRLEAVLRDSNQEVKVALLGDGLIVGWIHVFLALRIESKSFGELGGLVVSEEYRGRGVGRSLLSAAEEWASARGLSKLRVRTRSSRSEAHDFYKKQGFLVTKEQYIFDKDLR